MAIYFISVGCGKVYFNLFFNQKYNKKTCNFYIIFENKSKINFKKYAKIWFNVYLVFEFVMCKKT